VIHCAAWSFQDSIQFEKKNTFFIKTKWTVKKSHLHPGRGMSNTSWNPE